jgi:hypothetical protein
MFYNAEVMIYHTRLPRDCALTRQSGIRVNLSIKEILS